MPSPISPLTQALRLLKVELARKSNEAPTSQVTVDTKRRPTASGGSTTSALQRLPSKLKAERSQKDGLSRSKALRLFIEAVLLDELGSKLQLDPAFSDLVERTCSAIEKDPGNAALLEDALTDLDALPTDPRPT